MTSTIQQTEPSDNSCGISDCDCGTVEPEEVEKPLTRRQLQGLIRANKAKNKAFRAASRAQKRVMIAEDILSALRRGKLKAHSGDYVADNNEFEEGKQDLSDLLFEAKPRDQLQPLLEQASACRVCAKGALLLCTVAMRNEVTVGEFNKLESTSGTRRKWRGKHLSKVLGGIFTPKQLALIENEFEGSRVDPGAPEPVMHLDERYEDDDLKRMRIIFRNVIRNKGTFKPVPYEMKYDEYGFAKL